MSRVASQQVLPEMPAPAAEALAVPVVTMFERLATNPDVDVAKLEKLIAMQERILAHDAKAAFDAAFSEMQGEIPIVSEKGEILVKGELRSTYAKNEDIQRVVKPILQKHGFALRFRNEVLEGGKLKVIGILSHRSGHSESDEFVTKADDSGSKNDIQAIGSARSYGQRYTTLALLNIATEGEDDDGTTAERQPPPPAPDGYDEWVLDLTACADDGMARITRCWNDARADYRRQLIAADRQGWEKLRRKAAAVDEQRRQAAEKGRA
jgi:hypothetical protein